jgi:membrane-associated phospholipid phosphatase
MTNSVQANQPRQPDIISSSPFLKTLTNSFFWGILCGAVYEILFRKFDRSILYWVQKNASPFYKKISADLSSIFSPSHWLMVALLCLVLGVVLNRMAKEKLSQTGKNLLFVASSLILTAIIGEIIKYSLARYRPEMLLEKNLYGFHFFSTQHALNSTPSGHTMMSVAGLLALSLLIRKSWATWIFLLLALAVGISRIILSDHYASDVLLGIYIGSLSVYWVKFFRQKSNKS